IVTRDNVPAGVVTERGIIRELVTAGEISADMAVERVMTTKFVRVSPDMSVEAAAEEMLSKKGRLLVFDDEELVGVLTVTDLVRAFSKSGKNPSFRRTASMHVYIASADESVASVLRTMHETRIGSLLITEKGAPSGIFTERDLLTKVLYKGENLTRRVGDFASRPLIELPLDSGARDAAALMVEKKIKRLPLRSESGIMGIVTARDVVEAFVTS
ncbi:MAG: cyclic nucleotide-binding/CBS domain-containing protein, partial [Nitrososphaerales archaeon]